ncbi:5-formyltetrahydrofolate cyclo-ligase [Brevibacillus sp. B_LB10_24]|uniref:5-formyltetrahydrofolate cyclo-ligase n=1 Tax=Brevibacillus sp. B_LB10_24 TaxID=3380645 RepID=UPI0038BD420E
MQSGEQKQILRKRVLEARASLSAEEREQRAQQMTCHLLAYQPLAECRSLLGFYPFRDEIDIRPFLAEARKRGQEVYLPLTIPANRRLIPYLFTGESTLRTGVYGIAEPDPSRSSPADPDAIEAVIVPGVVFDRKGGRIGYGGGYYDRFLAGLDRRPLLIGVGFMLQVTGEVPREAHDQPLDCLVTEEGVFDFACN